MKGMIRCGVLVGFFVGSVGMAQTLALPEIDGPLNVVTNDIEDMSGMLKMEVEINE